MVVVIEIIGQIQGNKEMVVITVDDRYINNGQTIIKIIDLITIVKMNSTQIVGIK